MTDNDPDPMAEIRAIRQKIWRKYKTMDAYFDHFKTIPPADVLLARVRAKIEKAKAQPARRPSTRRRQPPAARKARP